MANMTGPNSKYYMPQSYVYHLGNGILGTVRPANATRISALSMSPTLVFRWYYIRKGVEHGGRKVVKLSTDHSYISVISDQIAEYIELYSVPSKPCNVRLVIRNHFDEVVYDKTMQVRVMNELKKKYTYLNG